MNSRPQLRHLLARQWVIFTVMLFSGVALLAVLLSFMLEDSFIDQRLDDVASAQRFDQRALPAHFSLYPVDQAPPEWQQRMSDASVGSIREFRLNNGQYLHVRLSEETDGNRFFLAYDVSEQLFVNTALSKTWPVLLSMAVLLAVLAWYLANRFSRQVANQVRTLIQRLGDCDDVAAMQQLAEAQPVAEFAELARLNAEALQRHVDSLNREKETLAFLSHELRTPMQSIRNSLDLLDNNRHHVAAFERLQRAARRLQRAAHSILWLAASTQSKPAEPCAVKPILSELVNELSPLAATRQQQLLCTMESAYWLIPAEMMETIFANLLLNAIQHGDPGEIHVRLTRDTLTISNPTSSLPYRDGFGLGLQIVQRLLQHVDCTMQYQQNDSIVELRLSTRPDIELCY